MLLLDKLLLLEYPEARAAEFKHPKYYQVWESPEEAKRSQTEDDGAVSRWLLATISQP